MATEVATMTGLVDAPRGMDLLNRQGLSKGTAFCETTMNCVGE